MKHLLILLLLVPLFISGQNSSPSSIQFGYYGDIIFHPGFSVAYETPIKSWAQTKSSKKGSKEVYKSLNIGIDGKFYLHKNNHLGIILGPSLTYRRTRESGRFWQAKYNIGLHRSIIKNPTYTVSSENIVTKKSSGQFSLINTLSIGAGKDLRVKRSIPIRYFWDVGMYTRSPINHSILPGIQIGFGIHYFLKS